MGTHTVIPYLGQHHNTVLPQRMASSSWLLPHVCAPPPPVHAEAPRPTRAEATDIANLVLDGADGILLASETFRGLYPVLTVKTVSDICRQAETVFDSSAFYRASMEHLGCHTLTPNMSKREALASSAVRAAEKSLAKLMIVFTVTGLTAQLLAKYKPLQPILAVVCPTPATATYSGMRLSKSQVGLQSGPI